MDWSGELGQRGSASKLSEPLYTLKAKWKAIFMSQSIFNSAEKAAEVEKPTRHSPLTFMYRTEIEHNFQFEVFDE